MQLQNDTSTRKTGGDFASPRAADAASCGAAEVASTALIKLANLSATPLRLIEENAVHHELGQLYLRFKEEQIAESGRVENRMNLIMERVDKLIGSLTAVERLSHKALEYEWYILDGLTEHTAAVEKQNITDRLKLVAEGLQKRHPDLKMDRKSLTTAVVIHNQIVPVLKISLLARSKVFEAQSRFGEDLFLNLDDEKVDHATKEAFLTFLQQGWVDLSVADPVELLLLADKYDVKELRKPALNVIKENISDDNVLDLLKAALFLSNKDLAALCMLHLFNSTLTSEDPELSTILHSLTKLKAEGGSLIYSSLRELVDINFENWTTDNSELLNALCKHGELRLRLKNNVHDELSLSKLLQNSPQLHHLIIRNDNITTISGADNLKTLDCCFSAKLTSLNALEATTIYCIRCPLLRSLSTPMAITLYCRDCPSLKDEMISVAKGCAIIR